MLDPQASDSVNLYLVLCCCPSLSFVFLALRFCLAWVDCCIISVTDFLFLLVAFALQPNGLFLDSTHTIRFQNGESAEAVDSILAV